MPTVLRQHINSDLPHGNAIGRATGKSNKLFTVIGTHQKHAQMLPTFTFLVYFNELGDTVSHF